MKEVDSKSIYKQAINKIVEDFIENDKQSNNYKYINQNGKLGKNNSIKEDLNEKIVSKELKKALEWRTLKVSYSVSNNPKYSLNKYQYFPPQPDSISDDESPIDEKFEKNEYIIENLKM